jgi:hypothetical protein
MSDHDKLDAIANARPGTKIIWKGRFRTNLRDVRTLRVRKDNVAGWWLADGSGLDDFAFVENWDFVAPAGSVTPAQDDS